MRYNHDHFSKHFLSHRVFLTNSLLQYEGAGVVSGILILHKPIMATLLQQHGAFVLAKEQ